MHTDTSGETMGDNTEMEYNIGMDSLVSLCNITYWVLI